MSSNISSAIAKSKIRQSNIELLRCVAMFMVLVLHANFKSFGGPDSTDLISCPMASFIRVFFEMLSIVAVNVFVLISGWFGIRPSFKGFTKFIFQFLFFSVGIYVITILLGLTTFSIKGVAECFAFKADDYWFIPSYICLYIFSPVLNEFIDNADHNNIKRLLISFFCFQTLYSCLGNGGAFLMKGYSALSFMGLYILAGLIRKNINLYKYNKRVYLYGYLIISLVLTLAYLFFVYINWESIASRLILYSNPLIILSALLLLLYFTKLKFSNKFINKAGLSCFAVYLFHCNPNLFSDVFIRYIRNVANECFLSYLMIFGIVIIWFVIAILLDQVRIVLWNKISETKFYCSFYDNK